jgi:hypothetical protein
MVWRMKMWKLIYDHSMWRARALNTNPLTVRLPVMLRLYHDITGRLRWNRVPYDMRRNLGRILLRLFTLLLQRCDSLGRHNPSLYGTCRNLLHSLLVSQKLNVTLNPLRRFAVLLKRLKL